MKSVVHLLFARIHITPSLALLLVINNSVANAILPINESFNPSIPQPKEELGFQVGEWHAHPEQVTRYMQRLAETSNRATLKIIGRSVEQRPLLNLIITSPENQAQLESLRQQHLNGDTDDNGPLVVWLGYSIHGSEPSGSNAALLVAYHLIASEAPWIKSLLKNTIVIIDPLMNPDGLARFSTWVNMHRGQQLVGDRLHRSRMAAWPSGRFNHYWFDLNRDWLPASQPESVARLRQFYRWRPHVSGDFHEGGDGAYFFQPGVPQRQNPLTPKENIKLTETLAQYHAQALESISQRYYTRETYDDFYPGKGSTFPDLNGSVGILYEALWSGGHQLSTNRGDYTFSDTVRTHYITGLSTLKGSNAIRQRLLDYSQRFHLQAMKRARKQKGKAWVISEDGDPARAKELVKLLKLHQIEVYRLGEDVKAGDIHFFSGEAWVVPIQQRQSLLIEAVFEQRTTFDDNKFYDVSAWTLPSAYNLEFARLTSLPKVYDPSSQASRSTIKSFSPQSGAIAYTFSGNGLAASAMALHLLNNDIRVYRVGYPDLEIAPDSPIKSEEFVVPVPEDKGREYLEQQLAKQAKRWQVPIRAHSSGFNLAGPDLGSPSIHILKAVKPLLVVGKGVDAQEAGHIWHLLDRRLGIPVPMIDIQHPGALDLGNYTHLLIPDVNPKSLPKSWHPLITHWVNSGGVLITQKRSAQWAEALFSVRPKKIAKEITEDNRIDKLMAEIIENNDTSTTKLGRRPYGQYRRDSADRIIGGAIFLAKLDLTHPLAQGYNRETLPVFINSLTQLKPSKNSYSTPLVLPNSQPLAGYASNFAKQTLKDKPVLVADKVGKGLVIKFGFNPNFRAFWRGTEGLYINALVNASLVQTTLLPINE